MAEQLRHVSFPNLSSVGAISGLEFRDTIRARAQEITAKMSFWDWQDSIRPHIAHALWQGKDSLKFIYDMAQSAGIEFITAAIMEIPEVIEQKNCAISSDHCSGWFQIDQGRVTIIHNEDDIDYVGMPESVYKFSLPVGDLKIVGIAYPGDLLTNSFFMRSDGLVMSFYHVDSKFHYLDSEHRGLPRFFFLNKLLTITSLEEGIKLAKTIKHFSGGTVMLADSQSMVVMEFAGDAVHVEQIEETGFHTNQYRWLPTSCHQSVSESSMVRSGRLEEVTDLQSQDGLINLFSTPPIYNAATWATVIARPREGDLYIRGSKPGEFIYTHLTHII